MQTRRDFIIQLAMASLPIQIVDCFNFAVSAFADNPCNLDQTKLDALTTCSVIGTPSTDPGSGISGSAGVETIVFDDSEGTTIDISDSDSINPADPNYQLAVQILSQGQVPLTLGTTFDYLAILLGVLADLLSEGAATPAVLAWLNAENIGRAGIVFGSASIALHALGKDPPRSDTNVASVFQIRGGTAPAVATPQGNTLQALSTYCFQLSGALAFLIATKERIETLTAAKNFGGNLVAQFSALNTNSRTCGLLLSELATSSKQLASYLQAAGTQSAASETQANSSSVASAPQASIATGDVKASTPSVTMAPQATASAGDVKAAELAASSTIRSLTTLTSLYAQMRPQLQAEFNAGPNALSRLDTAASAVAQSVDQAQLVATTNGAPLLTQLTSQFQDVASQSMQAVAYLDFLVVKTSSVTILTGTTTKTGAVGSGGTSSGGASSSGITKPLKGELPCTKC